MPSTYQVGVDTSFTQTPASGSGTVTDLSNMRHRPGAVATKMVNGGEIVFKWVLVEDAAVTAGQLLCYTTDDNQYEVTNDRSGGTSDNNKPAGLAVAAIADGDFGWIQIGGISQAAITTDGGVAADERLIAHASTDGGADSAAGSGATDQNATFGYALDADTSTTLAAGLVILQCPR